MAITLASQNRDTKKAAAITIAKVAEKGTQSEKHESTSCDEG